MRIALLILLFLIGMSVKSQDYPREKINISNYVDDVFQLQSEGVNYELLYENLVNFYQDPINLNNTDFDELASLFILSNQQINALLKHIDKNEKLISIYELQSIEGFDLAVIFKIMPFVIASDRSMSQDASPLWKRMIEEENNSIIIRTERTLQQQKGFLEPTLNSSGNLSNHYLGSPYKNFVRYRVNHKNDFSLGFTMETDKGEQMVWNPDQKQYGMDFYSFHFQSYNKGIFKTIAIGDYNMQIGQSLIFAGGFLIGKNPDAVASVRRSNVGIRPYTSAIEGGFFRGISATAEITKNFDFTTILSSKKIDATQTFNTDLEDVDEPEIGNISVSLSGLTTGNHRTPNELAKKNNSSITDLGGILNYKSNNKNLTVGLSALQTMLSDSINVQTELRNLYNFSGKSHFVYGANYHYNWRNFSVFGEAAHSSNKGTAVVQGILGSLSKKLQFAWQMRYFSPKFHSFYANPFMESSTAKNEFGIYWGINYNINGKWDFSAYYDQFYFPWLRFSTDKPSHGYEYLARLTYKPQRNINLYVQYKMESKFTNYKLNEFTINPVSTFDRQLLFLNLDHRVSKVLTLKTRLQFSSYGGWDSTLFGSMIYQDFNYKFWKMELTYRFGIFDTEGMSRVSGVWSKNATVSSSRSYSSGDENRMYTFEKDVLYAYSIYSFSGSGTRTFLLLRYTPIKRLDFWIKYGVTAYRYLPGYKISPSGLDEINGNIRSDVRVQMRYRF